MLSKSDRVKKGSTTAALDEMNPDSQDRGPAVELSPAAIAYETQIKNVLLAELATKAEVGDGSPKARRGKPDELRASDYESQSGPDVVGIEPAAELVDDDPATIHGQAPGEENVAALQETIDQLETLRKARELEKAETKKAFEAEEQRLLAVRDEIQRGLERARQLEAQRGVRGHIAQMRRDAQAEIPPAPADRRGAYHKAFLTQLMPLLDAVKTVQADLSTFAKSTLPFLKTVASMTASDVPASWMPHHRAGILGLTGSAAKLVEEHRAHVDQAARVVRVAEQLLAQDVIADDADQRTRGNGLLRDLGYASSGVIESITQRAGSIASSFDRLRSDGTEFALKAPGTITIILDPPKSDKGRVMIRRGEHHRYDEPKTQPGVLDSLGIDTSTPPRV